MNIIAHRGLWSKDAFPNSSLSFTRAIKSGFGIELDIRDHVGQIVVSHDPPSSLQLSFLDVLAELNKHNFQGTLAVNIKSDGIASLVKSALANCAFKFFVFDASLPQILQYHRLNIPFYTRISEYEREPLLYKQCSGVWLDSFESDWFDKKLLNRLESDNKNIVIVSPELHGRNPNFLWSLLKDYVISCRHATRIGLCTDRGFEAQEFFGDQCERRN